MVLFKEKSYGVSASDLKYDLTSSDCIDEQEYMSYTTYGIRVTDFGNEAVLEFPDISTDKYFVEDFIALCETHLVALVHIEDVLEDYLP
ncbi:hypothetical protein FACS1894191_7800 [Clostridia bacterium]|nr:hypothetical protein FACS1894191_7800 [Clostridia bacterium]